jgi:hypothetical protein
MYLISIILVESLAGVRLMGVCLEALRFFNLGWHGRDALKADLKDSDLSATAHRTHANPMTPHLVLCGLQPSAVARRVAAPCK